eukprot:9497679-Pyramimonas_sp.AAC.1
MAYHGGRTVHPLASTHLEEQCLSMLLNSKGDRGLYTTAEDIDVRWTSAGHPSTDGAQVDIILDSSDGDSRSTCDNEPPSPPPGCSSSDGEWVWMTNEGAKILFLLRLRRANFYPVVVIFGVPNPCRLLASCIAPHFGLHVVISNAVPSVIPCSTKSPITINSSYLHTTQF